MLVQDRSCYTGTAEEFAVAERKHLKEIEVFIGVETNLKKHKKFDLSCFRTYSIDRTQRPGGAIIFLVRKRNNF